MRLKPEELIYDQRKQTPHHRELSVEEALGAPTWPLGRELELHHLQKHSRRTPADHSSDGLRSPQTALAAIIRVTCTQPGGQRSNMMSDVLS